MPIACGLIASTVVAIVGAACFASDKAAPPEIAITLQQPKGSFTLGRPILLTVVFHNNLKRDVQIEGFDPEAGHQSSTYMVIATGLKGCKRTDRTIAATTKVVVERLSGKSVEGDQTISFGAGEARSFLLKAGSSEKQSFDLMQTWEGAGTIDSPGRFRVSLLFKVQAKASEGYQHSALEWEGEARARPIEINVNE